MDLRSDSRRQVRGRGAIEKRQAVESSAQQTLWTAPASGRHDQPNGGTGINERPRVVHLVPALFGADGGVMGGAERYALELARHMAGETPTVLLTFGDRTREETVGRLRIRVIGNPWYVRGQRFNPVALSMFGALRGADIVHCHQQHVLASSLAAVACRITGRRVFVTDLG